LSSRKPVACELVIGGEVVELVPIVFDPVDAAIVRPVQLPAKLKVVRWVGEHDVDALFRQTPKNVDRVALDHTVDRQLVERVGALLCGC